MTVPLLAGVVTFLVTSLMTIAGVGAAFILIPVFVALGVDVHVAMATALLLNVIGLSFASYRYIRARLVLWKVAIPILVVASALSPFGAWVSQGLPRDALLWGFVVFLLFASLMMLFYKAREREVEQSRGRQLRYGLSIGGFAGFMAGLLGVGGGNFIVPVLVWLGINPKKAAATTSFIVIFSSLSGFLAHATAGSLSYNLLGFTVVGSIMGAMVGAWLMTDKLDREQVKLVVGVVLLSVAAKMVWGLLT